MRLAVNHLATAICINVCPVLSDTSPAASSSLLSYLKLTLYLGLRRPHQGCQGQGAPCPRPSPHAHQGFEAYRP
eukprot:766921-Hanusia_phi.AAC.2